jgi:hypothetical protein
VHELKEKLRKRLVADASEAAADAANSAAAAEADKAVAKAAEMAAASDSQIFSQQETTQEIKLTDTFTTKKLWDKTVVETCRKACDNALAASIKAAPAAGAAATECEALLICLSEVPALTEGLASIRKFRLNGLELAADAKAKAKAVADRRKQEEADKAAADKAAADKAAAAAALKQQAEEGAADMELEDAPKVAQSVAGGATIDDEEKEEQQEKKEEEKQQEPDAAAPEPSPPPSKKKEKVSSKDRKELDEASKQRVEELVQAAIGRSPFILCDLKVSATFEKDGLLNTQARAAAERLVLDAADAEADRFHVIFFDPPKGPADCDIHCERAWGRDELAEAASQLVRLLRTNGVLICICNSDQFARLYVYLMDNMAAECVLEEASLDVIPDKHHCPKSNQKKTSQIEASSAAGAQAPGWRVLATPTHRDVSLPSVCVCLCRLKVLVAHKRHSRPSLPINQKDALLRGEFRLTAGKSALHPEVNVLDHYSVTPQVVVAAGSAGRCHLVIQRLFHMTADQRQAKFGEELLKVIQFKAESDELDTEASAKAVKGTLEKLEQKKAEALTAQEKSFLQLSTTKARTADASSAGSVAGGSASESSHPAPRSIAYRRSERSCQLMTTLLARFYSVRGGDQLVVLDACSGSASVARSLLVLRSYGIQTACVSADVDALVLPYARQAYEREARKAIQNEVASHGREAKLATALTTQMQLHPKDDEAYSGSTVRFSRQHAARWTDLLVAQRSLFSALLCLAAAAA